MRAKAGRKYITRSLLFCDNCHSFLNVFLIPKCNPSMYLPMILSDELSIPLSLCIGPAINDVSTVF